MDPRNTESLEWKKWKLKSRLKYYFPYANSQIKIAPHWIDCLNSMQMTLGLLDVEYREAILGNFSKFEPYHRIFTNDECADIVFAEMKKNLEKLNEIYSIAEQRTLEAYQKLK